MKRPARPPEAALREAVTRVFLVDSRLPFPIAFARHAWFVVQRGTALDRYEFGKFQLGSQPGGFGLHHNILPPFAGLVRRVGAGAQGKRHPAIIRAFAERQEMAQALAHFIEHRSREYPGLNRYNYLGPNSNTYVQWILRQFPLLDWQLPPNAIGRNFRFE